MVFKTWISYMQDNNYAVYNIHFLTLNLRISLIINNNNTLKQKYTTTCISIQIRRYSLLRTVCDMPDMDILGLQCFDINLPCI